MESCRSPKRAKIEEHDDDTKPYPSGEPDLSEDSDSSSDEDKPSLENTPVQYYQLDGDEMDEETLNRYMKQIRESEGFDVDPIPGPRFLGPRICGGLYPMTCIHNDEIRDELTDCSKSAMESYNKNKNTNYQYVDFVKANVRGAAGAMYFITFQAKDPSDGSCVIFQAQVWRTIKDTNEVMLCRIKPTQ